MNQIYLAMSKIFKRIKSFFTSHSGTSDRELTDFIAQQREMLDHLTYMVEELIWKEAVRRKKLEMIQDSLLRMGVSMPPGELDIPPTEFDDMLPTEFDILSTEFDNTTTDDETPEWLASIMRKIKKPVREECEKAGTDAVDDLVKAVNSQMTEWS
jgi:hypothetical protein